MKGENLLDEKRINYSNLATSLLFKQDYLNLAAQLKHIDLNKLIQTTQSDSNLIAFFISNKTLVIFRQTIKKYIKLFYSTKMNQKQMFTMR